VNVPAIFEVGGFIPVPEIIAIEFWGLQTPNLGGRGGRGGGRRWYRSKERW